MQQGDASAAHRDGHVHLRVRVSASDARTGPPEDHGGRVDRSAAILSGLLSLWSRQATVTQAVRLRDVTRVSARVVGDPENRQTANIITASTIIGHPDDSIQSTKQQHCRKL